MFVLPPNSLGRKFVQRSSRNVTVCVLSKPSIQHEWGIKLPCGVQSQILHRAPPLLRLPSLLTSDECEALIRAQEASRGPERDNYLNHDAGVGNGYRQGISPTAPEFQPIQRFLNELFPHREPQFAEALWHRPRYNTYVVRDITTVRYGVGEGIASHVDGKDTTLLIYLSPPLVGGHTVFQDVGISAAPEEGDALLYESRKALTHYAAPVEDGVKWVLQVLIDYRVRPDDR